MKRSLILTALATASLAVPASAQQSTTRGFNVGLHFQGASISAEGQDRQGGGGGGLHVGYGFNRVVTGFLRLDGSSIDIMGDETVTGQWVLGHFDLGARFHFANALRRWVPYLEAAVGARAATVQDGFVAGEQEEDVTLSGAAFTLGGGLNFYTSEGFAIDAGVSTSFGEFTKISVGGVSVEGLDIDVNSARFNLGFIWWP